MEKKSYVFCYIIFSCVAIFPTSNNGFRINSDKRETAKKRDTLQDATPCNKFLSVPINDFEKFDNGSILSLDDERVLYSPEMYWLDVDEEGNEQMRGCMCWIKDCIRKCCPENKLQAVIDGKGQCVTSDNELLHPFQPTFSETPSSDIKILLGNPCEYGSYRVNPLDADYPEEFTLHPNGILSTGEGKFNAGEYCLEVFEDAGTILPLVCFPPDENYVEA